MGKSQRDKGYRGEHMAAKALGWKRGRAFSGEPDVYCGWAVGSVKWRGKCPVYLEDALQDACSKAAGTDKEPYVIQIYSRPGRPPYVLVSHIGFDRFVEEHGLGFKEEANWT